MNLFKIVKTTVTVKQAAALYGLPITTTGDDPLSFPRGPYPSMKLNDAYYYCFGCGATGDVIDLTARLFTLSSLQGGPETWRRTSALARINLHPARLHYSSRHCLFGRPARGCFLTVSGSSMTTMGALAKWRTEFAPRSPEEALDERFVEALHMLDVRR